LAKGDDIKENFDARRKRINDEFEALNTPVGTRERIISIIVLALIFVTIWFVLDLVIVTFILTFVFYHLKKYALRGLAGTPLRIIPAPVVQILVYAGVIALFVFFLMQNAYIIIDQIGGITAAFANFDLDRLLTEMDPHWVTIVSRIDFNAYIGQAVQALLSGLASIGNAVFNFVLALVLSFIFVLEKNKIARIAGTFKTSRIAFIYRYLLLFFSTFSYTFGKVMKVQVLIAACNAAIFVGYMLVTGFPYVVVLGILIFLFSLIPVVGVILSSIPLLIIAVNIGGPLKALEVLIVIIIIQAVEAYTLEPKLMSNRTALPVSLVFIVLILSQHYIGLWGMLIGIPFFIFAMNALDIDYSKAL